MEIINLFEEKPNIAPEKLYYKIGEVSKMLGVKPSVIRFWESEFNVSPSKSKSNQRIYEKKDIVRFFQIKQLLYDERFTIEGAKKKLRAKQHLLRQTTPLESEIQFLKGIRRQLTTILNDLSEDDELPCKS